MARPFVAPVGAFGLLKRLALEYDRHGKQNCDEKCRERPPSGFCPRRAGPEAAPSSSSSCHGRQRRASRGFTERKVPEVMGRRRTATTARRDAGPERSHHSVAGLGRTRGGRDRVSCDDKLTSGSGDVQPSDHSEWRLVTGSESELLAFTASATAQFLDGTELGPVAVMLARDAWFEEETYSGPATYGDWWGCIRFESPIADANGSRLDDREPFLVGRDPSSMAGRRWPLSVPLRFLPVLARRERVIYHVLVQQQTGEE